MQEDYSLVIPTSFIRHPELVSGSHNVTLHLLYEIPLLVYPELAEGLGMTMTNHILKIVFVSDLL